MLRLLPGTRSTVSSCYAGCRLRVGEAAEQPSSVQNHARDFRTFLGEQCSRLSDPSVQGWPGIALSQSDAGRVTVTAQPLTCMTVLKIRSQGSNLISLCCILVSACQSRLYTSCKPSSGLCARRWLAKSVAPAELDAGHATVVAQPMARMTVLKIRSQGSNLISLRCILVSACQSRLYTSCKPSSGLCARRWLAKSVAPAELDAGHGTVVAQPMARMTVLKIRSQGSNLISLRCILVSACQSRLYTSCKPSSGLCALRWLAKSVAPAELDAGHATVVAQPMARMTVLKIRSQGSNLISLRCILVSACQSRLYTSCKLSSGLCARRWLAKSVAPAEFNAGHVTVMAQPIARMTVLKIRSQGGNLITE